MPDRAPVHALSLFAMGAPRLAPSPAYERHALDEACWIECAPGWLEGADELLGHLVARLPWRQRRRTMWDREVDEPRLSTPVDLDDPATPAVVGDMAAALSARYRRTFDRCFANYYRDGRDSVAWHADREVRDQPDPIVAIVSLGGPRDVALRPAGGGPATVAALGSGDLLVMGGATQHRWEHAVPKRRHAWARCSLSFRHPPPRWR